MKSSPRPRPIYENPSNSGTLYPDIDVTPTFFNEQERNTENL